MNLDTIKARLANLQQAKQKGSGGKAFWKPESGKNLVRILPYKFNKDDPFSELLLHYEVTSKPTLSPTTVGKPDPIVEFAETLSKTGDKEDWKMAQKIKPKSRIYVPILVREKESEGVKYWGFGKEVFQELLSIIDDPDYGDITSLTQGRDVIVDYTSKEESGKNFPSTKVRVKPNPSVAFDDKVVLKAAIENQVDITTLFNQMSYDELKSALSTYFAPSDDGEGDTAVADTTGMKATSLTDVESDFDDLFKDTTAPAEVTDDEPAVKPAKKAAPKKATASAKKK